MHRRSVVKTFGVLLASIFFLGTFFSPAAEALKLSDLVKQAPQLYLPSQLVPGQPATFTLKGKSGQNYELILSAESQGTKLPDGTALPVGKATVSQKGVLPASGVVEITVKVPDDEDALGDKQYVEAYVWMTADKSDAKLAEVIKNSGEKALENSIEVGTQPDHGNFLVLPGDSQVTNVMRSLDSLNQATQDPHKMDLLDTGDINRNRQIDQNLNLQQQPGGLP
jgi:hypothetical protein